MQNNTPASEKQINFLRQLGYEGNVEGLTMSDAADLIAEYRTLKGNQPDNAPQQEEKPKTTEKKELQTNKSKALMDIKEKNISDSIIKQLTILQDEQGLVLPKNYNATNALKMAYLKLAESNLLDTDQTSLAQALLNMCIQGLSTAKNQCYFINYAGKVNMMRSYFGDRTVCINAGIVQDIQANIIYKGDTVNVNYVDDYITIEHQTDWKNFGNEIIGAYAWAILPNGKKVYDIMTIDRIKKSWAMSKNNSNNKLQQNFTDDACKRTVIRHLAKTLFNQTGDNDVLVNSYNRSTENEYDTNREFIKADVNEVHDEQKELSGQKSLFDNEGVMEDDNI